MTPPTPEQLAKLPRWAQEHIHDLTREREQAIKLLDEWTDQQTPAPFYIDELCCTGEKGGPSDRRRYVQTHRMTVDHCGVRLDIVLRQGDDCIDLQWGTPDRSTKMVAAVPASFQKLQLFARDKMR